MVKLTFLTEYYFFLILIDFRKVIFLKIKILNTWQIVLGKNRSLAIFQRSLNTYIIYNTLLDNEHLSTYIKMKH